MSVAFFRFIRWYLILLHQLFQTEWDSLLNTDVTTTQACDLQPMESIVSLNDGAIVLDNCNANSLKSIGCTSTVSTVADNRRPTLILVSTAANRDSNIHHIQHSTQADNQDVTSVIRSKVKIRPKPVSVAGR